MLKNISTLGWCYFTFGLLTCGYFCAAAIGGWKGPTFNTSGSSYGRGFGGSWGGGK
jgi:hypothetical protein